MKLPQPAVEASDGTVMSYTEARSVWEGGEFSEWVEQHGGWPIQINWPTEQQSVQAEECEEALSDDTWDA